jgi:hypothetical protein
MLDQLLDGNGNRNGDGQGDGERDGEDAAIDMEIVSTGMMSSELIAAVRQRACRVLCLADLPPSPSSKSRYLVKKLHAAFPELTIVVGRWAPDALADDNPRLLSDAGATHVATKLLEARDILRRLQHSPIPGPAAA